MQQLNYEPLITKVTSRDVADLKTKFAQKKPQSILQVVIILLVIGTISPVLILTASVSKDSLYIVFGQVIFMAVIAMAVGVTIIQQQARKWQQGVRINRFAEANGLKFSPKIDDPVRDGMIFNIGHSRNAYNILTSKSSNSFEIANYTYTTGSGKSSHTYIYGYIMVQLDRNLPHIVLDSKANNTKIFGLSISDLPVEFNPDQKLSLEGDFDSHFTLYAPKEYEQDALYIFTPDLMQLFIDDSLSFDAEIVDNNIYIYSNTQFDLTDQALLQRLFHVIDTVVAKVESKADRYIDERVGSAIKDVIAVPGRRLKIRKSWMAIVLLFFYIIYFVFSVLYPMLSIK